MVGSSGVPMRLMALVLGTGALLSCDTSATSGGGSPYRLELLAGDGQTAEVGSNIPVVVRATVQGHPFANLSVRWTADAGGSAPTTTQTDAQGLATATWTLGPRPGTHHLIATIGTGTLTKPVTLTATATIGGVGKLRVLPKVGSLPTVRDSLRLTVTATDRFGNAVALPQVEWYSLDPFVASVTSGGMVHGVSGGSARIVAAYQAVADTASVQVYQVAANILLEPDTLFLYTLNRSGTLRATARDVYGNFMPAVTLAWSAADGSVASVDGAGKVTALGNGITTIVARSGGVAGSAAVRVSQVPGFLTIAPLFPTVLKGDSVRITVAAFDSLRSPAPSAPLYWSSSDTGIVALHGAGWAVARVVGQATIRVTAYGGDPWAQSVVTVVPRP